MPTKVDTLTQTPVDDYQIDLAVSVFREGNLEEAEQILTHAYQEATHADALVVAANNIATCEIEKGNYSEALRVLSEVAPLIDSCQKVFNIGNFHYARAWASRNVAEKEGIPSYNDTALIGYEAARFHFELAERFDRVAFVENNVGFLKLKLGRTDAIPHLDRAIEILEEHGGDDKQARIAEIKDTRALALLETCPQEAFYAATESVTLLSTANEPRLLATSLETLQRATEAYLRQVNRGLTEMALKQSDGNMSKAAEMLGITREGVRKRLATYCDDLEPMVHRRS